MIFSHSGVLAPPPEATIRIVPDKDAKTLVISDDGISTTDATISTQSLAVTAQVTCTDLNADRVRFSSDDSSVPIEEWEGFVERGVTTGGLLELLEDMLEKGKTPWLPWTKEHQPR